VTPDSLSKELQNLKGLIPPQPLLPKAKEAVKGRATLLVISIVAILTSTAPPSCAFPPWGRHIIGIIQMVSRQAREAELLQAGQAKPLTFTWDKQTKFLVNQHFVDAGILSPGVRVEVVYHRPFFGAPYVTKVTLLSPGVREK
jgi:hypothetical protein